MRYRASIIALFVVTVACGRIAVDDDSGADVAASDAASDEAAVQVVVDAGSCDGSQPFACGGYTCDPSKSYCLSVGGAYFCTPNAGCHTCECLEDASYPNAICISGDVMCTITTTCQLRVTTDC